MLKLKKVEARFILLVVVTTALFLCYLVWGWWWTISRLVNLLISFHVLAGLAAFLFYIFCRYVRKNCSQKKIFRYASLFFSAFLISLGISAWGFFGSHFTESVVPGLFGSTILGMYLDPEVFAAVPVRIVLFTYSGAFFLSLLLLAIDRLTHLSQNRKAIRNLVTTAYAIFLVSILTCAFSTNLFQSIPGEEFRRYRGGNATLLIHRLENGTTFLDDLQQFGGFNYRFKEGETLVYLSQTGFHVSLLKLFLGITQIDPHQFLGFLRVFFPFLLACIMTYFSLQIKNRKGGIASLVFILPIPFTFWIMAPAKVLVWFYFIFYLPFLYSVVFYPRVQQGKWTYRTFLLYLLALFIFIFLRGYTHLSNLILSAAIPVFYYELKRRSSFRFLLLRCITTCLVGLGAFCVVFILHLLQISSYLGSIQQALAYFFGRTSLRVSGIDMTYGEVFKRWMEVPVFYLTEEFFLQSNGRPYAMIQPPYIHTWNSFRWYHIAFMVFAAAAWVMKGARRLLRIDDVQLQKEIRDCSIAAAAGFAAMLSSWSWFLAKEHMATHLHQNGIMFMFPFGLTFYILAGLVVQVLFDIYFYKEREVFHTGSFVLTGEQNPDA